MERCGRCRDAARCLPIVYRFVIWRIFQNPYKSGAVAPKLTSSSQLRLAYTEVEMSQCSKSSKCKNLFAACSIKYLASVPRELMTMLFRQRDRTMPPQFSSSILAQSVRELRFAVVIEGYQSTVERRVP